jgi:peptidoglycan hydrolase CwlO-like protein
MTSEEEKFQRIFRKLEEIDRKFYLQNEELASLKQQIKELREKIDGK